MNVNFKPFDNKLGRQAINYALDTHVMLKHIYDGNGAVVNGPLGSTWVCFDPKIKRYPDNLKRPRELLGKAGYANGLEIKLYFAPDRHLKGNARCVKSLPIRRGKSASKWTWSRKNTPSLGARTASTAATAVLLRQ